jgi:hypothetical protein
LTKIIRNNSSDKSKANLIDVVLDGRIVPTAFMTAHVRGHQKNEGKPELDM